MQPPGLPNLGNTCYFNSVLQPLCHTHSFSDVLEKTCSNENAIGDLFLAISHEMQMRSKAIVDPTEVRKQFIKRVSRFNNKGQHDSHECLRHFLDEIRKEERKGKDSSSGNGLLTSVDKVFGGHLITVYICEECDRHYHLLEPCLDISLPVFFEPEEAKTENQTRNSESSKETNLPQQDFLEQFKNFSMYKLVTSESSFVNNAIGLLKKVGLTTKLTKINTAEKKDYRKVTSMFEGHSVRNIHDGVVNNENENEKEFCQNIIETNESGKIQKNQMNDKTNCISSEIDSKESSNKNDETNTMEKQTNYKQSIHILIKPLSFQYTDSSTHSIVNNSPKSSFENVGSLKRVISLANCLEHFSREEQIRDEYLCEDCLREAMTKGEADEDNLKLTSATKQTLIFNPPAVLTIHFKRFELLPGRSKKRSDMVEYPEHLDIAPYCSSQCLRNDPPKMNIWYSLYAVVVHSGSLDSGHYFAYVKMSGREDINQKWKEKFLQHEYFNHNLTSDELMKMTNTNDREEETGTDKPERKESKWFLLNDNYVREASTDEVLEQEAYLLFYERRNDTEISAAVGSDADYSVNSLKSPDQNENDRKECDAEESTTSNSASSEEI